MEGIGCSPTVEVTVESWAVGDFHSKNNSTCIAGRWSHGVWIVSEADAASVNEADFPLGFGPAAPLPDDGPSTPP